MKNRIDLNKMDMPGDVKKLSYDECDKLAAQIRRVLIETVSHNGGHLSSNLGTVELTISLHRIFDSPEDRFVWDVGHQAYTHKLLTGRAETFDTIRTKDGLSGFPRPDESEHDAFICGHSSISVSAALGIATAMKLKNDPHYTVAILGDGAFTGGECFEGMNNAGKSDTNLILVLNYNEMSISKNVGALAKYLSTLRTKESYHRTKDAVENVLDNTPLIGAPIKKVVRSSKNAFKDMLLHSNVFEYMGFKFVGPIDGHNIEELDEGFAAAKPLQAPTVVLVETQKGHGYPPAEANPGGYHGVSAFELSNGNPDVVSTDSYSCVFGRKLADLAYEHKELCAVTAAMKFGTGLQYFQKAFPDRFFDVGIAEQHAVTFCAGLASSGFTPVFAVYSTFLQRGYDQLLHDVGILGLHMVFGVDRAGIVGEDGETHQGIFDVSFLTTVPNIKIYSPSGYRELEACLEKALFEDEGVCAVRYPRGADKKPREVTSVSTDFVHEMNGSRVLAVTYGRLYNELAEAQKQLEAEGKAMDTLKIIDIFPLSDKLEEIMRGYDKVFFFEESYRYGGIGEKYAAKGIPLELVAIDGYVPHGKVSELLDDVGLSAAKIKDRISAYFEENDQT